MDCLERSITAMQERGFQFAQARASFVRMSVMEQTAIRTDFSDSPKYRAPEKNGSGPHSTVASSRLARASWVRRRPGTTSRLSLVWTVARCIAFDKRGTMRCKLRWTTPARIARSGLIAVASRSKRSNRHGWWLVTSLNCFIRAYGSRTSC